MTQQMMFNSFRGGTDSASKQSHLNSVFNGEVCKDSSLTSDSDDNLSSSEEFKVNFNQMSKECCGLGCWISSSNTCSRPTMPRHSSDKLAFISKSHKCTKTEENSLSLSYKNTKRFNNKNCISKKSNDDNECLQLNSAAIKHKNIDIPHIKIPKNSIISNNKINFRNSLSESSSSECDFPVQISEKDTRLELQHKSFQDPQCKISSQLSNDSNCLKKSFQRSKYSESKSQISCVSHDILNMAIKIELNIYSEFLNKSRNDCQLAVPQMDHRPHLEIPSHSTDLSDFDQLKPKNVLSLFPPKYERNSLSFSCDIPFGENKSTIHSFQQKCLEPPSAMDRKQIGNTNERKRSHDHLSSDDEDNFVVTKRRSTESVSENEEREKKNSENNVSIEQRATNFVKFIICHLRSFENAINEKFCLTQPNAMKFLAQNHATNWELNKDDINQMHLVPCGFLNEIFHRALYCYGLETKVQKDTSSNDLSQINTRSSSHSTEYKKIKDEYAFSLTRVRYGIGIIDELFRYRVNYQNLSENSDVPIVRKWKHIIYYLCLHAKSAFMAKEIQYHNFVTSNLFEVTIDLVASSTPTIRSETYNKSQLAFPVPKDISKLLDCKVIQKLTPENLCQSDFEISPHSSDSGKGSSIRTSCNTNSIINSGCHTTSSLNSTPHSIQETQFNLSGFQLYRIDEYQTAAKYYVQSLPEASELHNRIISKIGMEPNANSRDNMLKLIYYIDICQEMCKEDLMNECLKRLLDRAMRL